MASNRKSISRPDSGHDEETGIPRPSLARKTSKQKREEMMQAARSRTHSSGSTLGAFYQGEAPAPAAPPPTGVRNRRRSSRRPSKAPLSQAPRPSATKATIPPQTVSDAGSDLGDVASMALAGLMDEDLSELLGGAPPPSKQKSRRPRSPPSKPGKQLPTIMDDFEHQHTIQFDMVGGLSGSTGVKPNLRMSVNTIDSLRVSEASTDLEDDVAAAITSLERDNSMFLSEQSDVRGFNSRTDLARPSLHGSSILDSQGAPPKASSQQSSASNQQQEIANFAAMLHGADYGAVDTTEPHHPLKSKEPQKGKEMGKKHSLPYSATSSDEGVSLGLDEDEFADEFEERDSSVLGLLDPTEWLIRDLKFTEDGVPYFDDGAAWTIAGFVRYLLYNPIAPEFTSLQQFCWSIILGILMGFYTAGWKEIIEHSVDIMWKELPEALLEWGFFTELDGAFPLYHWMWICPAFWGGLLSYIFAWLPTPIPGQNEWITAVHTQGVQDSETFFLLFVLSTLGMASGLSLGPELPLVLTAGMIGSWIGIQCKQTVLQARVMNITCAGAAVGGFFGFPMAGALFVLEIPHRMGLQYFEALSPATMSSIVAVLCNRMVTGNDVTGYYSYPFLTTSLPSEIFSSAVFFGLFGGLVGISYAKGVLKLKGLVHDFFHAPHDHHDTEEHGKDEPVVSELASESAEQEKTPLILKDKVAKQEKKHSETNSEPPLHKKLMNGAHKYICCVLPYEPHRAAAAGVVAGLGCGGIGIFLPQVMFWGEAQLQSMIDKGRTPLPVFGREDEPTAALTALAFCMIDSKDPEAVKAGFSIGCSFAITVAKIVVTGLSLGTGIVGGHFWGPLFAGCAASHFIVDVAQLLDQTIGFGGALAAYPCVAILCTMGATHVVTFRAHMAIMLILTLTISAFDPEDSNGTGVAVAGDYSAVFPLLVVSVFVSLMISRQTVFYKAQCSRVDISARPEVLCQPGQEGMPVVVNYHGDDDTYGSYYSDDDEEYISGEAAASERSNEDKLQLQEQVTQEDIEKEFNAKVGAMAEPAAPEQPLPLKNDGAASSRGGRQISSESPSSRGVSPLPPRPTSGRINSGETPALGDKSSARLDELLAKPMDSPGKVKARHRRIQSAPDVDFGKKFQRDRAGTVGEGGGGGGGRHNRSDSFGSQASAKVMRVTTIGNLSLEQPSLMDQARLRSATSVLVESRHVRHPSMPTRIGRRGGSHSRQSSGSSIGYSRGPPLSVSTVEVERAFTSAVNQQAAAHRTVDGIHELAMLQDTANRS